MLQKNRLCLIQLDLPPPSPEDYQPQKVFFAQHWLFSSQLAFGIKIQLPTQYIIKLQLKFKLGLFWEQLSVSSQQLAIDNFQCIGVFCENIVRSIGTPVDKCSVRLVKYFIDKRTELNCTEKHDIADSCSHSNGLLFVQVMTFITLS